MSCNRENVSWQSKDGSWNLAFYEFWNVDRDKEDWDYEWDVEYGSDFHWVTTGHASREAAREAWTSANPGGGTVIAYTPESAAQCDALDAQAEAAKKELKQDSYSGAGVWR